MPWPLIDVRILFLLNVFRFTCLIYLELVFLLQEKRCSGAIVRFSDNSSSINFNYFRVLFPFQVVWRRASEPNPISVGELLFSSDKRYNVSFSRERREFNLLIRNVQPTDAGVYECQVSSRDKIIRHVLLKVNGKVFTFFKPMYYS